VARKTAGAVGGSETQAGRDGTLIFFRRDQSGGVMLHSLWVLAALAAADDGNLARALRAASRADSYAFAVEESPGGAVEGTYQKGRPVSFRAGRIAFFRQGDALVYRQADTWRRSKTGTESDPLAVLGAAAQVRGTRLPHEELAGLAKHLRGVTRSAEGGQGVYSADLTEEGAKALARPADRGVARGGTAKLWVDGQGRLVRYDVVIQLKGRRGNAEVDGESVKTITLRDVGAAKVAVPDEVKKLLE
jgi:hypothetical protein